MRSYLFTGIILTLSPFAAYASQLNDILTSLQGTTKKALQLVMTIALLVFVWGIVKLIAAAGNPQKIKEAKAIILWGIIGVAVMGMIAGIVLFIQGYLGIPGGGSITPPQFKSGMTTSA